MFSRLPLRRCIHIASTTSRSWNRTAKVAFGASAATATYLTWRLTNDGNRLALDSAHPTRTTQSPNAPSPPGSSSNSSTSETKSPNRTHVDDPFVPDPEQPDTQSNSSEETSSENPESSDSGGGGGAFNPQTGEINWDCPCLGGMAHGPCGPEFREAFSCFVFSEVEPKGIDCVEKFKAMQNCFRAHPDVYADEIMDDDEDDEPVNSENPEGLPPVTDSSERIANDAPIPQPTTEKKPQLQKSSTR